MQLYAAGKSFFEHRQELPGHSLVYHNTFNCIADTWTLDFCIFCNAASHFKVGRFINKKMTDTTACFYYRNPGILHNILNQFLSAARKTYIYHSNGIQNLVYIAVVMLTNFYKLNCFRNAAGNPSQCLSNHPYNFYI